MSKNFVSLMFNQFAWLFVSGFGFFFAICLSHNVLGSLMVKVRDGKNFLLLQFGAA